MATTVTARQIREAKKFLQANNVTNKAISPRRLTLAAAQLDKSLSATLRIISRIMTGARGSQSVKADQIAKRGK